MIKNSVLQKIFFLIAMLCLGFIVFINISGFITKILPEFIDQFNNLGHKEYLIYLIAFLLFAAIAAFLSGKGRKKKSSFEMNKRSVKVSKPIIAALVIFSVSLAVKLIFVYAVKTEQYSDFQLFYWVTAEIAKKTPKYLSQSYFSIWAYQVGFPAIMSPILKIFGIKVGPLIITNCVFMSVTNVLIYLIARQFIKERLSILFSVAYACFPFVIGLSSVYTNQHLAAMFFYIGIYLLVYKKSFSIGRALAAGAVFALGNMVRPEAIIIILSLAAFILLVSLNRISLKKINIKACLKKIVLPVLCAVNMYFVGTGLISQFFVVSGLNPHGLANNFPLYKFVIGFNQDTLGTFSQQDADYLFSSDFFIKNPDLRDKEAMKIIGERVSVGPQKLADLFLRKTEIMWTSDSRWYPAFNGYDLNKKINLLGRPIQADLFIDAFTFVDSLFFLIIFIFIILSMVNALRSKENSIIQLLLTAMFVMMFFIYFLIEVQHRYSYVIFPALFILAASGLDKIRSGKHASGPKVE